MNNIGLTPHKKPAQVAQRSKRLALNRKIWVTWSAFAVSHHPKGLNMVEISISGDHLHLEVKGLDKLWAFKSQLDIPLNHIRGVRHDAEAASGWWHGVKRPGTNIPGVLT